MHSGFSADRRLYQQPGNRLIDASRVELSASRVERYSRRNFLPTALAVRLFHASKFYLCSVVVLAATRHFSADWSKPNNLGGSRRYDRQCGLAIAHKRDPPDSWERIKRAPHAIEGLTPGGERRVARSAAQRSRGTGAGRQLPRGIRDVHVLSVPKYGLTLNGSRRSKSLRFKRRSKLLLRSKSLSRRCSTSLGRMHK